MKALGHRVGDQSTAFEHTKVCYRTNDTLGTMEARLPKNLLRILRKSIVNMSEIMVKNKVHENRTALKSDMNLSHHGGLPLAEQEARVKFWGFVFPSLVRR